MELARLLAPGGALYVSMPFNFRVHGPLPDAWRLSEHGLKGLLERAGPRVIALTALETPGRPLMPAHHTAVAVKDVPRTPLTS